MTEPETPTNLRTTVVLGMHRSGTSAVTGCLHELGLALPRSSDLISAPDNPQHFESRPVANHNELLLRERGGSWDVPGDPRNESTPVDWADEAERILDASFPSSPFVLKDPRLCLTFRDWSTFLDPWIKTVLVVRDPSDIARSLQRRDGIEHTHALALWERYLWAAEQQIQNRPCFVLPFEDLQTRPEETIDRLADFVGTNSALAKAKAVKTIDGSLGGSGELASDDLVTERMHRLLNVSGPHESFESEPLGLATWATEHLAIIARVRTAEAGLRRARRRPMKIAAARLPIVGQIYMSRAARGATVYTGDTSTEDASTEDKERA